MNYKNLNNLNSNNPLGILIHQNNSFMPILNSYGKILDYSTINKIDSKFVNKTEISYEDNTKKLTNIKNYKLLDLQNIATENNISLFNNIDGKNKKKTKQMLYHDINEL